MPLPQHRSTRAQRSRFGMHATRRATLGNAQLSASRISSYVHLRLRRTRQRARQSARERCSVTYAQNKKLDSRWQRWQLRSSHTAPGNNGLPIRVADNCKSCNRDASNVINTLSTGLQNCRIVIVSSSYTRKGRDYERESIYTAILQSCNRDHYLFIYQQLDTVAALAILRQSCTASHRARTSAALPK